MHGSDRFRFGVAAALCSSAFLLCLTLSSMPAAAQQPRQVLHNHVRAVVASGEAEPVGRLPATQRLSVALMLPLRNQSELTSLLTRMYDSSAPDYRHFLSVAQFTEQFGPAAEDYQAVVDFAKANGLTVTATPVNRMLVDVSGSVAQIENALHVAMTIYQHPTEKRTFYAPDREPSLDLVVPVSHIAGLNDYSIPRPTVTKAPMAPSARGNVGSGPGGAYLGSDMRAAYYGGTALTGAGQAVGLFELSGYNLSDVDLTFSSAGQSYGVPINNVLIDGASGAPNGDDSEEVLDIVQAISMAPGLSQVRVYIAPSNPGVSDVDIFNQMASENLCKQLSVSWAWSPEDASANDAIFQEFAAQGQNLFAASGDWGAFPNFLLPFYYPSEDAYVTAVGGTDLTTNGAGGSWQSETAWNYGFNASGGGISPDGIALPIWQSGVANSSNGASTSIRNVPDVAAEAHTDNYVCVLGSCSGGWGGTSFAAPRWAGFLALVNQQVVTGGQPTVGFINPALYSLGLSSSLNRDFHDISTGNNNIDGGASTWYSAVAGYDLVTGWGSPNGQNLIDALPQAGFALSAVPNNLTVLEGLTGGVSTITVSAVNGFTGTVHLAASGLPRGVTASFNPAHISGGGTSKLTLTASSSVTTGNATVIVTGTSGSETASTRVAVSVDFALSVSPHAKTVTAGKKVSYGATLLLKAGFNDTVDLSVAGLPPGASGTFSPPSLNQSGESTLNIATTPTMPTGTYTLAITAVTGNLAQTASVTLVIDDASDNFSLGASPASLTIGQTSSTAVGMTTLIVTSNNTFTSPVTLNASGVPAGVQAVFSPNPVTPAPDGSATSVLTLTELSAPAPFGSFAVTVTGTAGYQIAATPVSLTVNPYVFQFWANFNSATLTQGMSSYGNIGAHWLDGRFPITLGITGLPSGVSAVFSQNPMLPVSDFNSSTLTLTASPTATSGTFPIVVSGTADPFTNYFDFNLTVASSGFTISGPASLTLPQNGSESSRAAIRITSQNGFNAPVALAGVNGLPDGVQWSFSSYEVTPPPNGSVTTTLTLSTAGSASTGSFPITVTASLFAPSGNGLLNSTAPITLEVTPSAEPTYVTLTSAFNRIGIGWRDGLTDYGTNIGLDGLGDCYSSTQISPSGSRYLAFNGIPFDIDLGYSLTSILDAVSAAGQTIALPAGKFSSLSLLGAAVNGSQGSQTFTVTYSDGSTTSITQSLSDWQKPQNYAGESKALTMAYTDNLYTGGRTNHSTYLYTYSFAVDTKKTVQSITLPNNSNVEVLALTLVP